MLAATKEKMSGSEKVSKNMYDISSIKRVTRKFLGSFIVSGQRIVKYSIKIVSI